MDGADTRSYRRMHAVLLFVPAQAIHDSAQMKLVRKQVEMVKKQKVHWDSLCHLHL